MVQLSPVRPDHLPYLNIPLIGLPRPPRSPDRTRSPVASPKNENVSNIRRRLSAISRRKWPNRAVGDRPLNRKSPPLARLSSVSEGRISERRAAWLATQC